MLQDAIYRRIFFGCPIVILISVILARRKYEVRLMIHVSFLLFLFHIQENTRLFV
jgi:hypothetical protein